LRRSEEVVKADARNAELGIGYGSLKIIGVQSAKASCEVHPNIRAAGSALFIVTLVPPSVTYCSTPGRYGYFCIA